MNVKQVTVRVTAKVPTDPYANVDITYEWVKEIEDWDKTDETAEDVTAELHRRINNAILASIPPLLLKPMNDLILSNEPGVGEEVETAETPDTSFGSALASASPRTDEDAELPNPNESPGVVDLDDIPF